VEAFFFARSGGFARTQEGGTRLVKHLTCTMSSEDRQGATAVMDDPGSQGWDEDDVATGERPAQRPRPNGAPAPAAASVPWILLEGMARVGARAQGLPITPFEAWEDDPRPLLSSTAALVADALGAARLALAGYEDPAFCAPANETADVNALTPGPPPPCPPEAPFPWRVASVAYVACLELREQAERLGAPKLAGFDVVDACDGARRAVLKALRALARVIREAEELPDDPGPTRVELARSLRTRHAYARWHGDVVRDVPTNAAGARIRLRCGLSAITRLIDEVGPQMRPADRRAVEALRARANVCLRSDPLAARGNHVAAAQINADLEHVAELMLLGVNRREELLEHDRRALARAAAALQSRDRSALLRHLRAAEGRSPAVDALTRLPAAVGDDEWECAIARLRACLDPSREGSLRSL